MNEPDYIIGVGTGRCGTKSLAYLLKNCEGWHAVHESTDIRWGGPEEDVQEAIRQLEQIGGPRRRSAAVGYQWIWVARRLLEAGADVAVICLYRSRDAFVESAKAAFEKNPLQPGSDASHRFPTCSGWGEYWDIYMQEVAALMCLHSVALVPMGILNEPSEVLSVCGIPASKQATEPWHLHNRN